MKFTKEQKELLALLPKELRERKDLTDTAKLVLADIILWYGTDYADKNGEVYRTNEDLMKDTGVKSNNSINSATRQLEMLGYVKKTSGKKEKKPNKYVLQNCTLNYTSNCTSNENCTLNYTTNCTSEIMEKEMEILKNQIIELKNEIEQLKIALQNCTSNCASNENCTTNCTSDKNCTSNCTQEQDKEQDKEKDTTIDNQNYMTEENENGGCVDFSNDGLCSADEVAFMCNCGFYVEEKNNNLISESKEKDETLPPTPLSFSTDERKGMVSRIDSIKDEMFKEKKNTAKCNELYQSFKELFAEYVNKYGENDQDAKRIEKWLANSRKYMSIGSLPQSKKDIFEGMRQGFVYGGGEKYADKMVTQLEVWRNIGYDVKELKERTKVEFDKKGVKQEYYNRLNSI